MEMASIETSENLEDIRQKRLAYYASTNNNSKSNANLNTKLETPPASVSKDQHNNRDTEIKATQDQYKNVRKDQRLEEPTSISADIKQNGNVRSSGDNSKTSTFYLSDPTSASPIKTEMNHQNYTAESFSFSKQQLATDKPQTGELDGYNETVERLIRATKEELLGLKSSDDIWTKIKQEKIQELSVSKRADGSKGEDETFINNNSLSGTSKTQSFNANGYEIDLKSKGDKGRDDVLFSQTVQARSYIEQSAKPQFSNFEPIPHSKIISSNSNDEMNHQQVISTKVEEIFSSRQYPIPTSYKTTQDSQDLGLVEEEKEDVSKSHAFTELGLETHRPESANKDDLRVEADYLNLGDTVTRELRTVLGEEKFRDFIAKSRRDIDDLHERSSNSSSRKDKTPRLSKDLTARSTAINSSLNATEVKPDDKEDKMYKKEECHKNAKLSPVTPKEETSQRARNEFSSDRKKENKNVGKANVDVKMKTSENFDPAPVTDTVVPKLDLDNVNKHESHRLVLNRPKHEPLSIYQEGSTDEPKVVKKERPASGENRLRASNYEQVMVPRNVAFSADEIYNQAYGTTFSGQQGTIMQQFVPSNVSVSGVHYKTYGAPVTPTTPVSQHHGPQHMFHTASSLEASIPMSPDGMTAYRQVPARHLSYSGEGLPVSHPAVQPSLGVGHSVHAFSVQSPYGQMYAGQDMMASTMGVGSTVRPANPVHIPHPPAGPSTPTQPHQFYQAYPTTYSPTFVPTSQINNVYHSRPSLTPLPRPPTSPPPYSATVTQLATHVPPPINETTNHTPVTESQPSVSMATQSKPQQDHVPQTPTMSNAEVQTDREELASPEVIEKVSMVEESTFTSVSQIKHDDVYPHPPSADKRPGRPSPRRRHKTDIAAQRDMDSRRHIEGIRQHHEQRRQQSDDERLSEEQLVERQKKFAKASLERYFTSLENVANPSSPISKSMSFPEESPRDVTLSPEVTEQITENSKALLHATEDDQLTMVTTQLGDLELESLTSDRTLVGDRENKPNEPDEIEKTVDNDEVANMFRADYRNALVDETDPTEPNIDNSEYNPYVMDLSVKLDQENHKTDNHETENLVKHSMKDVQMDLDEKTVVDDANTDVTLKAGGITDRLNDLGIDIHHIKGTSSDKPKHEKKGTPDGKKNKKKGKVLIVCPQCEGLNKEYMSWCSHCGEMIIGVEPMLVSKNKEGKIRTRPIEKTDNVPDKIVALVDRGKSLDEFLADSSEIKGNYNQDTVKKVSKLDLGAINDEEVNVLKKCSVNKNDEKAIEKDSNELPDEDVFAGLRSQKIEEEVVNDICALITDPEIKGIVKSHFDKNKTFQQDEACSKDDQRDTKDLKYNGYDEPFNHTVEIDGKFKRADNDFSLCTSGKYSQNNTKDKDVTYNDNDTDSIVQESFVSPKHNAWKKLPQERNVKASPEKKQPTKSPAKGGKAKVNRSDDYDDSEHFAPPPVPNFSAALPISHNELALKLPANSMEWSTDVSQVVSQNFEEKADEKSKLSKEERRRERRRKRGHGAIDVEVFGYEESRESRNSSRANRMVPLLNLGGNSSDDDSIISEPKPVIKTNKQKPAIVQQSTTQQAWSTPTHPKQSHDQLSSWKHDTVAGAYSVLEAALEPWEEKYEVGEPEYDRSGVSKVSVDKENETLAGAAASSSQFSSPGAQAQLLAVPSPVQAANDQRAPVNSPADQPNNEQWGYLFEEPTNQQLAEEENNEVGEDFDDNQPFLLRLVNQPQPTKSKQRPSSASKPVKSKVRQSVEEPGYKRKWSRSSTAWSSYNSGELNTASSLRSSNDAGVRRRPASAPKTRQSTSVDLQASVDVDVEADGDGGPENTQTKKKVRPFSADSSKRKSKKSKKRSDEVDIDDLDMETITHRLPKPSVMDQLHDHKTSPKHTYDKYNEMTPRIEAGTLSRWQCLPDELLLYIFAYLDQKSLVTVAQVCHHFYRVAMDESLWRYITIRKRELEDSHLEEVSERHPVSLALIQCYGDRVTAKGLRDLFKECSHNLKELNMSRCSRGALNGDSLLLHAAARCHNITHLDISWSNVTDSGLMAISNCCHRLESLCMNGCAAVSNDGLETLIKKHGTFLKVLEMFGCFNLSPRGLRSVANQCINLITLNLGQCYKITDTCISQMSTILGCLERLDLRGCKQVKDNCVRRVVKNCSRLKHLSLANCPGITDVSILEISTYLADIRSLDVCGCKNISDSSIRALVNTCTNLQHLDISSTNCTHRSVSMIANFSSQRLETLKINFITDVTEQSLIKLARHCQRLHTVHMYGCTSVRNLDKILEERPTFTIEL